ncbi:extracellular matrix regulator RemB [Fusobacterium hominis]|uniref:DUF370 domain-containing protein n=1 Tax=Fusobacterium hominis TaxID=2764326 RepID=A0A7G9GVH5_9FUSO|nr:DUF370 domain-containing protein [Fusobacterium hominis]QNM14807.1 DUF370 domain-containing protein [Fusobacterium hominis]
MYLYLEDDLVIPSSQVILIIDYIHFKNPENASVFSNKEIKNLALGIERSVVVTDRKIYLTGYTTQALFRRAKEFFSIVGGI